VSGIIDSVLFDPARILDGNPVPCFVVDTSHVVVFWNDALARMTGVTAAEVLGTSDHWRAFYPVARPVLADLVIDDAPLAMLEEFYGGKHRPSPHAPGGWEAEDFFPDFAPTGRWLAFSAAPIRDELGKVVGCVETLQDITERKQAESDQRATERRLTEIIAGSPVATFVLDAVCRVTHWNRACETLTGVSSQEMIGRDDVWRTLYAFETRRFVLAELIVKGATAAEVDQRFSRHARPSLLVVGAFEGRDFFPAFGKGGKHLHFMAAPLHDVNGNVVGAIETLIEISPEGPVL
jgi:PAS domain-containing protein